MFLLSIPLAILVLIFSPDPAIRSLLIGGVKAESSLDTPFGNITTGSYSGEKTVFYDPRPLFFAGDVISTEENIHYALLQRDNYDRVMVISGGLFRHTPELQKYTISELVYLEYDPGIIAAEGAHDTIYGRMEMTVEKVDHEPEKYVQAWLPMPQLFQVTCYKASGWTLLGLTQGFQRSRQDYYVEHDHPKQLWVRELRPGARTMQRGRNLPAALQLQEAGQVPECTQAPEQLQQMLRFFEGMRDWRHRRGDYAVACLVTVAVCASLCGVHRGQRDLAAFAAGLTDAQMRALRIPRHGNPRRYAVPKETTFFPRLAGSRVPHHCRRRAFGLGAGHLCRASAPARNLKTSDITKGA